MSTTSSSLRYVAIGDSFTEGVGDEQPDGTVRGWADLVAQGIADATGETIQYANLAIRGRLMHGILAEQLEPAMALEPTLVSFNGGGNDMLRPRTRMSWLIQEFERTADRISWGGAQPLLLAGANPTDLIPSGPTVAAKGDELTRAASLLADRLGLPFTNNWSDETLRARQYWSWDRLHLNSIGHHRVAANVLTTLGYDVPTDWVIEAEPVREPTRAENWEHMTQFVLPWIQRRLTGRSSGDGRVAKHPTWVEVAPRPTT